MNLFGLTTRRLDIAQKSLDLASREALLRAGNIANADTPGYRAKGLSFEKAMHDALRLAADAGSLVKTNPKHLPETEVGKVNGTVTTPEGSERIDGNTVNMDKEMTALADVDVRYGLFATIANNEIELMKNAISAK
ncbi:MAG: flagellar basal body rod protein FlgB [Nitrospinota bacterium]